MRLTGEEFLTGVQLNLSDNTVLDFWQWAFSDLQANNLRGIFAEWVVAKLLDIPLTIRNPWDEWDLITPCGVKLEIKTSAYLQSWSQKRPSNIVFSGLKGRRLNIETNQYDHYATYNADIYVFCLHIGRESKKWEALNLEQWRFYLLARKDLERLDQNSLSLNPLRKISQELTAEELPQQVDWIIKSNALDH